MKLVDASFADLTCDLSVDQALAPPAASVRSYTVDAGDSLWKIAQHFYGNGAEYPKIIAGNPAGLRTRRL